MKHGHVVGISYQIEQGGTLDEVLEEHTHAYAALVVTL